MVSKYLFYIFATNKCFDMKKKDLLKYCRYYKGEQKNPFEGIEQNKAMLCFYESCWLNIYFTRGQDAFKEYISTYTRIGLITFEASDNIPVSYKALLFNRYAKSSYSMANAVEPFKEFYKKYYY